MANIRDDNVGTSLPPMSALIALEAVGRWGSFSEAARRLGSTQPAISQQIAKLESYCGERLFQRAAKGAILTEAGKALFTAISSGLTDLRTAFAAMRESRAGPTVTIATDFALAALWMMPRLDRLKAAFPQLDLKLMTGQFSSETPNLAGDIAVLFGYAAPGRRLLFRERVYPVCAPSLMRRYDSGDGDGVLRAPLIYLDDEGGSGRWCSWEDWLKGAGIAVPRQARRLRVNTHTLAIQAAIAGQGVALGWNWLVQPLIEVGQLARAHAYTYESRRGYFIWKMGRGGAVSDELLAWLKTEAIAGSKR
jgi:DNA-binding transcriptional LysR family regulator